MRTPEEVAREHYPECLQVTEPEGSKFAGERFCQSHHVRWVGDLDMCPVQHILWLTIRARDAEVRADERAKVLAGFTREDVAPFFGHGHTSPGYWRLVGPKHYKPIPTPEQMSQEAIDELRRRLTGRSEP